MPKSDMPFSAGVKVVRVEAGNPGDLKKSFVTIASNDDALCHTEDGEIFTRYGRYVCDEG